MATSGDIRPYHVISDRHVNVASTENTNFAGTLMLDLVTPDGSGGAFWTVSKQPEGWGGWVTIRLAASAVRAGELLLV